MKNLLLTIILALTSITFSLQAEETEVLTFNLKTIDNVEITVTERKRGILDFQEFKGKAVLITLFGHRCPPCLREIPEFIELIKEHKDDLAIVALEAQGYSIDELQDFVQRQNINYHVIAGVEHNDFVSYLARESGYTRGFPLPLLIAVNKDGEVEGVQVGQLSQDELEMLVKDLNE